MDNIFNWFEAKFQYLVDIDNDSYIIAIGKLSLFMALFFVWTMVAAIYGIYWLLGFRVCDKCHKLITPIANRSKKTVYDSVADDFYVNIFHKKCLEE